MAVCLLCVFLNDPATTEFYTYCHTLSLHDALPISVALLARGTGFGDEGVVQARGDDAEAALAASVALLATDMGEAPAAAATAPLAATNPLRAGQIGRAHV